jgi:hypothetical protein
MTARSPHPPRGAKAEPEASPAVPDSRQDVFGVSPGLGPIPAVYVPRSTGRATGMAFARRAAARAGRLARGWAAGLRHRYQ